MANTMFEKIWSQHVVVDKGAEALLYIDRNLLHDGAFHAFGALAKEGRKVRKPRQHLATCDHYVPTKNREQGLKAVDDFDAKEMIRLFDINGASNHIRSYGMNDPNQGIVHVIGPETGFTLPGQTMTCGDSHTSTHGALGAYAFGIGATNLKQVLATQCLWQKKPKTFRITVDGSLSAGVSGKDVVLAIIAKIGTAGGTGHVLEYAGSAIRAMSMEGRLTVCNMSIEAGARAGMIAPDDTTYQYIAGREFAPKGAAWESALAQWRALPSDADATFDREVSLDGGLIEPTLTWGTTPEEALPVSAAIPDPASFSDPNKRAHAESALRYMGLHPGTKLTDIAIDRVFIGTCTNGRIEDLRAAAAVLKGRKARVQGWVSPGSTRVKRDAEAEGLNHVFEEAGLEWRASSCSGCAAMNGDSIPDGMRAASTSNRNFEGRQGKNARTHLMSPAMVAAAAVTGRITDVRTLT
jgi:3-isopropylmalate/(R)-2-methylmalate dehydratase large subunit